MVVISSCCNAAMRDLSTHIGSGGGARQLLPFLCTTINLKNTRNIAFYVGGQGAGGTTLASSYCAVAIPHVNDTSTFITKGHMLVQSPPHSRTWEVITLHKRRAHSYSLVKCCFASPVSERTALACNKLSGNLPSLQNKIDSSSRSTSVPSITTYFNSSSPTAGLHLIANVNHINGFVNFFQFRTFSTSKMANGNGSLARQNFHEDCEAKINMQINMELYASYVYMSMAYYFDREDVALPGLSKWFKKASDEEREHAEKFMKYQNQRGGRIVLQPIAKPSKDEWHSALEAVQDALELEKTVNDTLLKLHAVAGKCEDPQLCDFLESNYLEEQVHAIKELSEMVTKLKRVGTGLGEYIFDKDLACAE